jgi:citronellol/citronellal dehydrogenase
MQLKRGGNIMAIDGRTVFISGGSRGIGLAIAKKLAAYGCNIAIAAKTVEPDPRLPGTIHTAAAEIEAAGGKALPVQCDIRFEDQVESAVGATVDAFGGIDICINNASAIQLTGTLETAMKRFDLMHQINTRGTFLVSQKTIPHLKKSNHAHILNLSPPLDMSARWFARHTAYTMAKFGMSMCVLGMAAEFRDDGIGVNALWPLTAIDTAAVRNVLGGDSMAKVSRKPEIIADAAFAVLSRDPRRCTGNFFIDEEVLREEGVTDFSIYQDPQAKDLAADFFVPDAVFERSPTKVIRAFG